MSKSRSAILNKAFDKNFFVDIGDYENFGQKPGGQNPGGVYKKKDDDKTLYYFKNPYHYEESIREVIAGKIAEMMIKKSTIPQLQNSFPLVNFVRQDKNTIIGVMSKQIPDFIMLNDASNPCNTYGCEDTIKINGLYDVTMILQFVNHGDLSNHNNLGKFTKDKKAYAAAIDFSKALKPAPGPLKYYSQPEKIDELIKALEMTIKTPVSEVNQMVDEVFSSLENQQFYNVGTQKLETFKKLEDFKNEIKANLLAQHEKFESELLAWNIVKQKTSKPKLIENDLNELTQGIKNNLISVDAIAALAEKSVISFDKAFLNSIENPEALGTILAMAANKNDQTMINLILNADHFPPEVYTYAAYMSRNDEYFLDNTQNDGRYEKLTGLINKAIYEKNNKSNGNPSFYLEKLLAENNDNPELYQNMLIKCWNFALDNEADPWLVLPLMENASIETLNKFTVLADEKGKIGKLSEYIGSFKDVYLDNIKQKQLVENFRNKLDDIGQRPYIRSLIKKADRKHFREMIDYAVEKEKVEVFGVPISQDNMNELRDSFNAWMQNHRDDQKELISVRFSPYATALKAIPGKLKEELNAAITEDKEGYFEALLVIVNDKNIIFNCLLDALANKGGQWYIEQLILKVYDYDFDFGSNIDSLVEKNANLWRSALDGLAVPSSVTPPEYDKFHIHVGGIFNKYVTELKSKNKLEQELKAAITEDKEDYFEELLLRTDDKDILNNLIGYTLQNNNNPTLNKYNEELTKKQKLLYNTSSAPSSIIVNTDLTSASQTQLSQSSYLGTFSRQPVGSPKTHLRVADSSYPSTNCPYDVLGTAALVGVSALIVRKIFQNDNTNNVHPHQN